MAKLHFSTGYLTITNVATGSVTFTTYLKEITINFSREELDQTAVGCVGKARGAGLFDWSADIVCYQDLEDNLVDETLHGLVNGGASTDLAFRPAAAAQSAANPTYAGTGIILEYPIAFVHGETNMVSFTIWGQDGAAMTRTAT